MRAQLEQPTEEITRLRQCVSDLVSLVALPAIWTGGEPSRIGRTLLEVLLGMLSLDLVYVWLLDSAGEGAFEMVQAGHGMGLPDNAAQTGELLHQWLGPAPGAWPPVQAVQTGAGELTLAPLRLGLQGELGVLVAASFRQGFPTQTERLLLRVAANQAAIGLQETIRLRQQRQLAEELDRRVAQRTRELAAANQVLRREVEERVLADERLRLEEGELKQSEARKAAILNSALDCIMTIDHEGRVTEFNPAAERTFGYRREEVLGRSLAEVIIPPGLREAHQRGFDRFLATGESQMLGRRVEMTAMRADGSEFPIELAVTRIPGQWPPAFTGYLRDLTEQKQSEASYRLSEQALAKARSELAHVARVAALGALTASIAHEVNQPLSGIITNASTCLRMLAAEPPNVDGARETARRTIRDGHRASEVITRLRELFAKKDVSAEPMDLNEATREVIALSMSELQRHGAVLRQELADDLPAVTGDRVQLQQVILNLLLNAADAMGEVNDRPRHVVIRTETEGAGTVRLSVRDVGVGLDPADLERVFDAFYTTKSTGMGIGLAISRSIMERHHGRLWAAHNEGPGATFAFSLPCAPRSQ